MINLNELVHEYKDWYITATPNVLSSFKELVMQAKGFVEGYHYCVIDTISIRHIILIKYSELISFIEDNYYFEVVKCKIKDDKYIKCKSLIERNKWMKK